jgi:hypothetical protein
MLSVSFGFNVADCSQEQDHDESNIEGEEFSYMGQQVITVSAVPCPITLSVRTQAVS